MKFSIIFLLIFLGGCEQAPEKEYPKSAVVPSHNLRHDISNCPEDQDFYISPNSLVVINRQLYIYSEAVVWNHPAAVPIKVRKTSGEFTVHLPYDVVLREITKTIHPLTTVKEIVTVK